MYTPKTLPLHTLYLDVIIFLLAFPKRNRTGNASVIIMNPPYIFTYTIWPSARLLTGIFLVCLLLLAISQYVLTR